MLNKRASFSAAVFTIFSFILLNLGCANRQLPQGGPRDHDPPKLLKASPPDMTRNFKAKEIRLDFDEFFKLSNQYTEISMSPAPAKAPEYNVRKKSLVIVLKDSLEKNTTYVINFGKAIADVNESNVLKNFTYVFSTGAHIDSLSLSGKVINTLTQEREKDVTVMLFTLNQDSLLFGKKRPTIFATTDTAGNFTLNNLHPDDYKIYALKETTPNKIYDNDQELIGFSNNTIHLTKDTENVQLKLFRQVPAKLRIEKKFDFDGKMSFVFNKPLDNPSLKIVYPPSFDQQKIVDISKTRDTALLYMRDMNFDSIRVAFFDNNKPLDTVYLRKNKKESFSRVISFKYNISLADNKLRPNTDLTIRANYPIASNDASQVTIKEDSTELTNFTIQKDTADTKLYILKNRWRQDANYTMVIGEGAFTDIYGGRNKRTTVRFKIDRPENYSQLTLAMTVPDTGKSYLVELLNSSNTTLRKDIIKKNASINYKNLLTGKYKVKVTYDDNGNGKWDTGSIKLKRQPENIWVDETIINLRANWTSKHPSAFRASLLHKPAGVHDVIIR